jgi:hypothetical protein
LKEPKPLTRCYSYVRIITLRRQHPLGRSKTLRHCPRTTAVDMDIRSKRIANFSRGVHHPQTSTDWRSRAVHSVVIAGLVVLCFPACDSKGPRRPVSGTVSVEGVSVLLGSISFLPEAGHRGPPASTAIVDGKYQFTTENGPTPGPHRVIVYDMPSAPGPGPRAIAPSSPESSSVAKLGPAAPTPSSQASNQATDKTHWTSRATIPTPDSPATINFAFPEAESANALSTDASP